MDIFFIDMELTPHLQEQMKSLGIVDGLPYAISEDFKPNPSINYINDFLWSLPSPKRSSKKTWGTYAQAISMYMRFLESVVKKNWVDVTKEDLQKYFRIRRIGYEGNSPVSSNTWKIDITAITSLYNWALDAELIAKLPFKLQEVRSPYSGTNQSVLTSDLHEKIKEKDLKYIHTSDFKLKFLPAVMKTRNALRDSALSLLLLSTGLRIEEAHNLKLHNLPDPDAKKYKNQKSCAMSIIGKGKKHRVIRIPKHVLRDIQLYIENDRQDACERFLANNPKKKHAPDNLWLTQSGTPISIRGLQKRIETCAKSIELHLTPHMLRHSFAIFQLSAMIRTSLGDDTEDLASHGGIKKYNRIYQDPLRQLQKLMGHSHISTTFIYLDYLDDSDSLIDSALSDWTDALFDNISENRGV